MDEIRRPDITFVTALKPGETWAYIERLGIVVAHPDSPPVVLGDLHVLDLKGGEVLKYGFVRDGEDAPMREIKVRRTGP